MPAMCTLWRPARSPLVLQRHLGHRLTEGDDRDHGVDDAEHGRDLLAPARRLRDPI
jgi:hypothetical protein